MSISRVPGREFRWHPERSSALFPRSYEKYKCSAHLYCAQHNGISGASNTKEFPMKWSAPVVQEVCVGMEVTSYESAEIDPFN